MTKQKITPYINGVKQGIGFLSVILIAGIVYAAGTWSTTSPTIITNDNSLYTNSGNTLTSTKWNELVNKVKTLEANSGSNMLVKEVTVSSATNTVILDNLDGVAAGGYLLEGDVISGGGTGGAGLAMYINNDTTNSNYSYRGQLLYGGSWRDWAGEGWAPIGSIGATGYVSLVTADIHIIGNRASWVINSGYNWYTSKVAANMEHELAYVAYNPSVTNITRLTIVGGNTIGVGSVFRLYKRK